MYNRLRKYYRRLKIARKVNWPKTLYFNFKKFPFSIAKKLPVFFYGSVKFKSIEGEVKINAPIKTAMIGFGLSYEMNTKRIDIAELAIYGELVFNGYAQFGKDCFLFVAENARCEFGDMAGIASRGQIMCTNSIFFDTYARLGDECKVTDSNFHQMMNTITLEKYPKRGYVKIGKYNYVGSRTTLGKDTVTPDFCTIASNSLCNKDYSSFGENIVIGGIPAKKLKENISRDWEGERQMMENSLISKW